MFDGIPSEQTDPRKSTRVEDFPLPEIAPEDVSIGMAVEAIDSAIERVKAGGGTVVNGPMPVPGDSWIVQATDPQGAFFCLVAPKR